MKVPVTCVDIIALVVMYFMLTSQLSELKVYATLVEVVLQH